MEAVRPNHTEKLSDLPCSHTKPVTQLATELRSPGSKSNDLPRNYLPTKEEVFPYNLN